MRQYLSPQLRLVGVFELRFRLINETGFLIRSARAREIMGAADVEPISVSKRYGADNIRVPYIPGSSLKVGRGRYLSSPWALT